jgi:predicted DCC family thiol-disulfide oxidoreductase YuxK
MHDVAEEQKIILFDGICNLCNASVNFVLQRERRPEFKFASIQSEAGQKLLSRCGLPPEYAEAVLLIRAGKVYSGSTAALKIGQTLKFPWSFLAILGFIFPKVLRDWVYVQIAKHRYKWFGKRDVCMVPTEELRSRFYG